MINYGLEYYKYFWKRKKARTYVLAYKKLFFNSCVRN